MVSGHAHKQVLTFRISAQIKKGNFSRGLISSHRRWRTTDRLIVFGYLLPSYPLALAPPPQPSGNLLSKHHM